MVFHGNAMENCQDKIIAVECSRIKKKKTTKENMGQHTRRKFVRTMNSWNEAKGMGANKKNV